MNNLIDDEIKKLIQEMEQMMDESNKEKLQNLLEQIKLSNTDLEKELDRELELFKQFEFEQKVEETLDKLVKLKKEQEGLKKETTAEQLTKEELVKAQENLSQEMDKIKNDLNDLRKKNMDLEDKNKLPNTQKIENILSHIKKLKEDYRILIKMRYFEGMTLKEIEKKINTPLNTVKVKLFRAKKILIQSIEKNK